MKISIDVDCTPEEARRFMGLPDLTSVHDVYLDRIKRMMEEGVTPDMMTQIAQSWAPMGEAGMAMWRQMFERIGSRSA